MQKEKRKQTFWTIHSRGKTQSIEFRYTELMGVPQEINLTVRSKGSNTSVEMTPSEFQKTFLIFQSFHDLLLSSDISKEEPVFQHTKSTEKSKDIELFDDRDIDTDDWEPW
jgi:hypothetical protein